MTTTTPHTLSELADIGTAAACVIIPTEFKMAIGALGSDFDRDQPAREAFTKAILDAIGYKLPVDPEREAFEKWYESAQMLPGGTRELAFEAFKIGRQDAMKINPSCFPQTAKQPENDGWIPWSGGECPVEGSLLVEVKYRGYAETEINRGKEFRWNHADKPSDIIAYRIIPTAAK